MKIRKNHIHLFILLFAVSSLLVHFPSGFTANAAITTATVTDGDSRFIAGGAATSPRHVEFNNDGTKMFIVEGTLDFVLEWTLTTGFDISTATYAGNAEAFDLFKNNRNGFGDGHPRGIHFNTDGTKMFVVGNNVDEINEYSLSTGFDISSGGNSISAFTAREDIADTVGAFPQGIEFNTDGTKMFIMDTRLSSQSGTGYLYEYILSCPWQLTGTCGETNKDDPINPTPRLIDEILVSVGPNKAIVTDTDYLPNIQIQKGDSITITLNVADKGPKFETNAFYGRSDIESVSLYTNFGSRPATMNLYYANHFNSDGDISKTFYEWNANNDNVVYDFTKSVEWHNPVVRTAQFDTSADNSSTPAEDKLTITFYSTWNEVMPKSEIIVKAVDSKMGYSTTTLPFTLQVGEYDQTFEDVFGTNTDYRFVPLIMDYKVRESIQQWVDPLSGMTDEKFVSSLGLHGDKLPGYVKYLAQWVVEDKIDLADLIIAVEYIINVG